MVHLSSSTMMGTMTLFSIITFFVMPTITTPHLYKYTDDPCVFGFLTGFVICVIIWHFYARKLAYKT